MNEGHRLVYFIFCPATNLVKIGSTSGDPNRRFHALRTMNGAELVPLGMIVGKTGLEGRLHGRFHEYRHHGEWFEFCGEIARYIEEDAKPWPDPPGRWPDTKQFRRDETARLANEIVRVKAADERDEDIEAMLSVSPVLLNTLIRLALKICLPIPDRKAGKPKRENRRRAV